jgi:hypothetical protein
MGGSIANKGWMPNRATQGPGPDAQAEPKPTKTSYLLKSFYKLAFAVSLSCSPPVCNSSNLPVNHTGVADTRAPGIYFTEHVLVNHRNTSAPNICVGTANGTITFLVRELLTHSITYIHTTTDNMFYVGIKTKIVGNGPN